MDDDGSEDDDGLPRYRLLPSHNFLAYHHHGATQRRRQRRSHRYSRCASDADGRVAAPENCFTVLVGYPKVSDSSGGGTMDSAVVEDADGTRAAVLLHEQLTELFHVSSTQVRVTWWVASTETNFTVNGNGGSDHHNMTSISDLALWCP